jgi:hypothetical protein
MSQRRRRSKEFYTELFRLEWKEDPMYAFVFEDVYAMIEGREGFESIEGPKDLMDMWEDFFRCIKKSIWCYMFPVIHIPKLLMIEPCFRLFYLYKYFMENRMWGKEIEWNAIKFLRLRRIVNYVFLNKKIKDVTKDYRWQSGMVGYADARKERQALRAVQNCVEIPYQGGNKFLDGKGEIDLELIKDWQKAGYIDGMPFPKYGSEGNFYGH